MVPPFRCPEERRAGLDEVKRAVGIQHSYLDNWIYLFYENKKFDVKETIAKLNRRDIMERTVYSAYTITPGVKKSMRSGIVQYIGRDREGRPVLYFNTARDFPKTEEREERQANMDMFLSWTVRCSKDNPTSTVTWIVNQKDASMMKNTDLIFQKDMALRVSKFFPGVVARLYVCNMSTALTFVFKPLLRQLPKAISESIFLFSSGDLAKGKLLEFIPEDVLPVAMGGKNDCDCQANYEFFATSVENYFAKCIKALRAGITIKEMEMMEEYGVDRKGVPLAADKNGRDASASAAPSTPCESSDSHIRVRQQGGGNAIEVSPNVHLKHSESFDDEMEERAVEQQYQRKPKEQQIHLPSPKFSEVSSFPFSVLNQLNQIQRHKLDGCIKELCYHGDQLHPQLLNLMRELRDDKVSGERLSQLKDKVEVIQKAAHSLLCVFPPTTVKLNYPLFPWLIAPMLDQNISSQLPPLSWETTTMIDCSTPDNFLLSLQSAAVQYVDDGDILITENRTIMTMLSRISNIWSSNLSSNEVIRILEERYAAAWRKLVPYLQQYVECKVAMSIAEFIRFHGLLVSGGRIDCSAAWYTKLLTDILQYREMRRRNYIFHVFPPLFKESASGSQGGNAPPTIQELLELRGLKFTFRNVMNIVCLVERSLRSTLEQLASPVTLNIAARNAVEHYLEDTMSKIYITYESQRCGVSPQELTSQKQAEALRCLEAAQAPLSDFLFALSGIAWVRERESTHCLSSKTSTEVASLLRLEVRDMSERVCLRERARLLAIGVATVAYNIQGTFSRSAFPAGQLTQEPPEGHASALGLLFVAAGICQHTEGGSATSPSQSQPEETVNISSFLNTVSNLHKTASSILSEVLY